MTRNFKEESEKTNSEEERQIKAKNTAKRRAQIKSLRGSIRSMPRRNKSLDEIEFRNQSTVELKKHLMT